MTQIASLEGRIVDVSERVVSRPDRPFSAALLYRFDSDAVFHPDYESYRWTPPGTPEGQFVIYESLRFHEVVRSRLQHLLGVQIRPNDSWKVVDAAKELTGQRFSLTAWLKQTRVDAERSYVVWTWERA